MYISVMRKEWKHSRDLSIVYNYKATVSVTVTDNKVSMIDKGTYTLTLEGTGNYAGSTTVDVKVTDQLHNIANARVEVKTVDFTGNAVELVPYSENTANSYGIKISDKSGKILTQNDYELEYENNTNAGNSASVTVIGKGEYAGAKTVRKLYRYSKKRVCN